MTPRGAGFAMMSLLMACTQKQEHGSSWDGTGLVPDFSLKDVNPTSDTFRQKVSPRDLQESVSGWYFSHAT